MKATTLLLGGSGQVGTALTRHLKSVIAPSRQEFDLAQASQEAVRTLIESTRPDVIINCAAYTKVDQAEDETDLATMINGSAVGILAEVAADFGLPLVSYSTDYVFDGRGNQPYVESSPPDPINAYGRSKLIGEHLALAVNPATLMIRTSWVISGTHPNFVATMLRLIGAGRSLRVVNDQHGSPTIAEDLAVATMEALNERASGLLHLTNQGSATWFQLASAAVVDAALDPDLLSPCTSAEYPTRAPRPAYSVLGSERVGEIGVSPLPPWEDSLTAVVEQLMAL